jgi:DNA mismatch repair protein MutH
MPESPPRSVDELMQRAHALAGKTLGEIAHLQGIIPPPDTRKHKGWIGNLLESALGATAGSRPEPDFPELGIELKTLPVHNGMPTESTYICTVPLTDAHLDWQRSTVYHKLRHVLWIPVEADPDLAPAGRHIGMPLLWQPDEEQETWLKHDWQDLMDSICQGRVEAITAHHGNCLQIRPKAANGREQCWAINEQGERFLTQPRGFYLRRSFTTRLVQQFYSQASRC